MIVKLTYGDAKIVADILHLILAHDTSGETTIDGCDGRVTVRSHQEKSPPYEKCIFLEVSSFEVVEEGEITERIM